MYAGLLYSLFAGLCESLLLEEYAKSINPLFLWRHIFILVKLSEKPWENKADRLSGLQANYPATELRLTNFSKKSRLTLPFCREFPKSLTRISSNTIAKIQKVAKIATKMKRHPPHKNNIWVKILYFICKVRFQRKKEKCIEKRINYKLWKIKMNK